MSTERESAHTARTGPDAPAVRPLSRERIIDVVDRRGLSALTMRRLGEALGVEVEAMSLYRYVNGREDLLEGIVDQMVAQLHLCPGHAPPGGPSPAGPPAPAEAGAAVQGALPRTAPRCFRSRRSPARTGSAQLCFGLAAPDPVAGRSGARR
jgi:AcrR family transcriptional regulator